MTRIENTKRWFALLAGSFVFLVGFAVLFIMDRYSPGRELPGLWHYDSATWGDGVCLPLIMWSTVRLLQSLDGAVNRRFVAVFSIFGGFVGSAVVLSWLADPSPGLNWTLPEPHQFSAAGVYHATFLVVFSAVYSGLLAALVSSLRTSSKEVTSRVIDKLPTLILIGSTAAYGYLVVRDSMDAAGGLSSTGSIIAIALGASLLVLLFKLAVRGIAMRYQLLGGLLVASSIASVAACVELWSPAIAISLVSGVSAGIAAAWSIYPKGEVGVVWRRASVSSAFALATVAIIRLGPQSIPQVFLVLLVLAILVFGVWLANRSRAITWIALLPGALAITTLSAILIAQNFDVSPNYYLLAIGPLLAFSTKPVFIDPIKADFDGLIRQEMKSGVDSKQDEDLIAVSNLTYVRIGASAVSFLGALLAWTIAAFDEVAPSTASANQDLTLVPFVTLLVVPIIVAASARVGDRVLKWAPNTPAERGYIKWSIGMSFFVLVCFGVTLAVEWSFSFVALFASLLAATFVVNGAAQAGILLHGGRLTLKRGVLLILLAIATFEALYWALSVGVNVRGEWWAGVGESALRFIGTYIVVASIAVFAAISLFVDSGRAASTLRPMMYGIVQDMALLFVLTILSGWFPLIAWNASSASATVGIAVFGWLLLTSGLLGIAAPALLWILRNNDTHVGREWSRLLSEKGPEWSSADATARCRVLSVQRRVVSGIKNRSKTLSDEQMWGPQRFLTALDGHVAIQNVVAVAMIIPTIWGLLVSVAEMIPRSTGWDG